MAPRLISELALWISRILRRWANRNEYRRYLRTSAWQRKRAERLRIDGYRCTHCGSTSRLEVHHERYPKSWGDEPITWLRTLCAQCHGAEPPYIPPEFLPHSAVLTGWTYSSGVARSIRHIKYHVISKNCGRCGETRKYADFSLLKTICDHCCNEIWQLMQAIEPSDYTAMTRPPNPNTWSYIARAKRMQYAGNQCEECGSKRNLHMHHVSYATFGREYFEHVRILCCSCHKATHVRLRREAKALESTHNGQKTRSTELARVL